MAALDGLRILDMTQYEAGTACTQCLAWLGADVVKVEAPGTGDPGRSLMGLGDYFMVWNSNKRSVALDLRSPEGRDILLKMAPHYDVFVENYGPGVMEKLGLDYAAMRAVEAGHHLRPHQGLRHCPGRGRTTSATTWSPKPRPARFPSPASPMARPCGPAPPLAMPAPGCKWPWPSLPPMRRS